MSSLLVLREVWCGSAGPGGAGQGAVEGGGEQLGGVGRPDGHDGGAAANTEEQKKNKLITGLSLNSYTCLLLSYSQNMCAIFNYNITV